MQITAEKIALDLGQSWRSQFRVLTSSPCGAGLSSSLVWRLSTSKGDICLKAWPTDHYSRRRLAEIQQNVDLARSAGIHCVPCGYKTDQGDVCLTRDGYHWQASQWMPGQADTSGRAGRPRRLAAAKTLARLHYCWRQRSCALSEPPGIQDRWTRLQQAVRDWPVLISAVQTAEGPAGELGRRTLDHLKKSMERLSRHLQKLVHPKVLHFVVRDLHSEHVLFEKDEVTGVIDYGAARIDDPLLDLVRLLASLSPFDSHARLETFQFYLDYLEEFHQTTCVSSEKWITGRAPNLQWEDFILIDESSTLLSALQWLQWLLVQKRRFSCSQRQLLERWEHLVKRLDLASW